MSDLNKMKPAVCNEDSVAASQPGLARRGALQVGAGSDVASERESSRERSFDEGRLFYRGDASGVSAPSFNDRGWRGLDLPHDWRIEDLPYAHSDDGAATADPSVLMLAAQSAPTPTAPPVIGPFDVNADTAPDLDIEIPGFGRIVFPGGRSQAYTVGGIGWCRKHFKLPELQRRDDQRGGANEGRRVELRFDAVYQYSGSGIYQHTWLTVTGPVRISLWGVRVTTPTVDERNSVARWPSRLRVHRSLHPTRLTQKPHSSKSRLLPNSRRTTTYPSTPYL